LEGVLLLAQHLVSEAGVHAASVTWNHYFPQLVMLVELLEFSDLEATPRVYCSLCACSLGLVLQEVAKVIGCIISDTSRARGNI
jgi:hypothetical protein